MLRLTSRTRIGPLACKCEYLHCSTCRIHWLMYRGQGRAGSIGCKWRTAVTYWVDQLKFSSLRRLGSGGSGWSREIWPSSWLWVTKIFGPAEGGDGVGAWDWLSSLVLSTWTVCCCRDGVSG